VHQPNRRIQTSLPTGCASNCCFTGYPANHPSTNGLKDIKISFPSGGRRIEGVAGPEQTWPFGPEKTRAHDLVGKCLRPASPFPFCHSLAPPQPDHLNSMRLYCVPCVLSFPTRPYISVQDHLEVDRDQIHTTIPAAQRARSGLMNHQPASDLPPRKGCTKRSAVLFFWPLDQEALAP
jgi:hypothetical protein